MVILTPAFGEIIDRGVEAFRHLILIWGTGGIADD